MIEQLNLFIPPRSEPEPQPKPKANEYDGTWHRCVKEYRYNENGRPSGWVRIDHRYITAEDLEMYFERIAKPEWLNDD